MTQTKIKVDLQARIEKIMPEIFEKYAGPDELWVFADASDEKLRARVAIRCRPK